MLDLSFFSFLFLHLYNITFQDNVSFVLPCPGIHSVDQASLDLSEIRLPTGCQD